MQKNWKNIFKSYLSKISKGRFKSKEQKSALENIKLLYESQQAVIKIFNGYYSIVFETKHKINYEDENIKILNTKTTNY